MSLTDWAAADKEACHDCRHHQHSLDGCVVPGCGCPHQLPRPIGDGGVPVAPLAPASIREEREKVYGPPIDSMTNIGQGWGAALIHAGWTPPKTTRNVLPHVVAGMMVMLKVIRNVTEDGAYTDDTCPDTHNYATFGDEFHPRRPKGK